MIAIMVILIIISQLIIISKELQCRLLFYTLIFLYIQIKNFIYFYQIKFFHSE